MVGRVNMKERHKIQLALKFFKGKLTENRSEERRKVLFSTVLSKAHVYISFCEGPWACTIQSILFSVNT